MFKACTDIQGCAFNSHSGEIFLFKQKKMTEFLFAINGDDPKLQAALKKMKEEEGSELSHSEYSEADKKVLQDLELKATKIYLQVTGQTLPNSYVWYAMAKDLQCKISHVKNKWGRMRFELNGCDPGNTCYNGKDYFKKVVATRRYLLKEFQKKSKYSDRHHR